jgi:hypothetical protein
MPLSDRSKELSARSLAVAIINHAHASFSPWCAWIGVFSNAVQNDCAKVVMTFAQA